MATWRRPTGGLLLFIILINDAGFSGQSNDVGTISTCKKRLKSMNEIHLKFVDDLTIGEAKKTERHAEVYPSTKSTTT